jgi:hypothetical protein
MKRFILTGLLTVSISSFTFLSAFSQPPKVQLSNRVSIEFPGQVQRLQIESITVEKLKDSTGTYRAIVTDMQADSIYTQEIKGKMSETDFWDDYIEVFMRKFEGELKIVNKKLKVVNEMDVMEVIFDRLDDEDANEKSNVTINVLFDGPILIEVMFSNEGVSTKSISSQKFLNSLLIK